jgi:competence ComEA-like helix-hairpin-helix protein
MTLLLISALTGCSRYYPGTEDHIRLEWKEGDSFHLATRELKVADHTEVGAVDLESDEVPAFGEYWGDEVVWTYQVIETGLIPGKNDELYPFARGGNGEVAALSVIRASVEADLNDDEALLDADPVVYLVFHEVRDRLVGTVSFWTEDGERLEQRSYSTLKGGRASSPLSQTRLSIAPTYLAPFSARWVAEERTLEDGSLVTTVEAKSEGRDSVVDVFYDDTMSGELVVSRYQEGEPWPTWTMSDSLEIMLLSEDEVDDRRSRRAFAARTAAEDYDYRAALSASIDIDEATTLSAEDISSEGYSTEVYDEYRPWAGSWWPLKSGELIFGYDDRDTYSDRIRSKIDPIKKDMDNLSESIRGMADGSEKDAKRTEYSDKQRELVDELVAFYGGMLTDLDGGKLTVSGGKLTHSDGWSYDIDELSPMDKMALALYLDGRTSPNPFYLPAWEILNSYNPAGGSWWGHCNGWAAAAILTNEPRSSVNVTAGGSGLSFTSADIKGLLTEAHYSTLSHFYGARYYKEGDDLSDLSPAAFQRLINFYIREQGVPLVFDTTASEAVWNFPAWAADVAIEETTDPNAASLVNINTATADELEALPVIGEVLAARIIERREEFGPFQSIEELDEVKGISMAGVEELRGKITVEVFNRTFDVVAQVTFTSDGVEPTHIDGSTPESFTETWEYTLHTDEDGQILKGVWEDDSDHPDFAWVPYANPAAASSGSSENPYLPYDALLEMLGDGVERH